MTRLRWFLSRLATRENLWALALCLMLIALVVFTASALRSGSTRDSSR